MLSQRIEPSPSGRGTHPRRRWIRGLLLVAVLALGIADVTAGAGRTRPGGSGGTPPQRAAGRATYGYRGHHHGHYGGYYGYYGYRHNPYFYYGWAAWPWGWWYAGWPYYAPRAAIAPESAGVIETDVRPKKAEVRVDGTFVGQARDFNGRWDYLWLEAGEHVLEFSKDGFMTLRRHLEVRRGMYVRIVEQLTKGEGIDPRSSEDHTPTTTAAPPTGAPLPPPPPQSPADSGTLRRGLLRLDVEPRDAAVYLDGEFLARASELQRLHGALPVAGGVHTVEVVRPGYESRTVEVDVAAGKPARVEIVLVEQE